ncbi:MAG: glutamate 5-kinase [Clostridia bacterium]|nr:glutamate 5-kinase [Clostridia bacterium]
MTKEVLQNARRIVVKVGSSTLTHANGSMDFRRIEDLVRTLSDLQNAGKEMILVSSGAMSVGFARLSQTKEGKTLAQKQAAAAVGQCGLIDLYDRLFSEYSHVIAQILITRDVVENDVRRENARRTFCTLIESGVIPVVNENDTVSYEEIEFGDNDTLSAHVAHLCHADLLINLSDVDGLYSANPRADENAKLIPHVGEITDELYEIAGGAGTVLGTGGMHSKIEAASFAMKHGIPMVITSGADPKNIYRVLEGDFVGTLFCAK